MKSGAKHVKMTYQFSCQNDISFQVSSDAYWTGTNTWTMMNQHESTVIINIIKIHIQKTKSKKLKEIKILRIK